jgi:hypothetical protein
MKRMIPALRNDDEMGRNTFECFSQTLKVGGDVFGRDLESPLFHRDSPVRLDAWISIKHMPDRIHVHRLVVSFGDVIDDIAHCPCAGTSIRVNYVIDEVVVLLLAGIGGYPFIRCVVACATYVVQCHRIVPLLTLNSLPIIEKSMAEWCWRCRRTSVR